MVRKAVLYVGLLKEFVITSLVNKIIITMRKDGNIMPLVNSTALNLVLSRRRY